MLTTLSVFAVLTAAPGEASSLKINHVRATQGILGPARAEAVFLPGDSFVLCFDIEGLTVAADGTVEYSTAVEITDDKGKVRFKDQQPREQHAVNALGGGSVPAFVKGDVGVHEKPGDYDLKLTITDLPSKRSQTLKQKVTVLPAGFGLVRLNASTDAEGQVPAAALAAGQSLWIHAGVVGFQRNSASKQPHVRLSLRVLDADGKPTLQKAFVGEVDKDVDPKALSVPAQFHISLNRPGKFTVELEATDLVAKNQKPAKLTFPINVQATR